MFLAKKIGITLFGAGFSLNPSKTGFNGLFDSKTGTRWANFLADDGLLVNFFKRLVALENRVTKLENGRFTVSTLNNLPQATIGFAQTTAACPGLLGCPKAKPTVAKKKSKKSR